MKHTVVLPGGDIYIILELAKIALLMNEVDTIEYRVLHRG